MKKPICILCFLGLAWSLLAANHLSLPPARSAPPVMDQGHVRVGQAASDGAVQSLLFADDFERGSWQWRVDEGYEVRAEAANHMLHCTAVSGAPIAHTGIAWDDYRFEVRVRVLSGNSKIAIRVGELGTGYYLGLDADGGLGLEKGDGADWTFLGSDPGPYPAGQWHTLVLEGEGTQLRAYVDGELRLEPIDASYAAGSVLLQTGWGEADYDDVWVTGDAPVACPIVPASGLTTPQGIAFSPEGELHVYGTWICHIGLDGTIERVANPACPGDIAFDSAGTLYFIQCDGGLGRMLPDGSLEYFATIPNWSSMAMSPDDEIFVSADGIYRVSPDGSVELVYPDLGGEIAFDSSGNLFLECWGVLYKITPEGETTTVADLPDTGPGASLISLAVDGQGNAYLGQGIEMQRDPALPPFVPPVCVDEVYRITPDGEVTVFTTIPGGAGGLTFGPDGALYATEWNNGGVSRISSDGTVTPIVPGNGLALVGDIAYSPDGTLYVLNMDGWTVARVTAEGAVEIISSGLNLESSGESQPALTFDGAGNLYVAESGLVEPVTRISKFTPDGVASVFTADVDRPSGLAFHPTNGDLYVSEALSDQILRFSPGGTCYPFVNGLNQPMGLAFGPDGLLYVAEIGEDRVLQIDATGTVTPFVILTEPIRLVFLENGLLVSTETDGIWRVDPAGTATLFASGPSNGLGITLAPDGSVVVAFGDDSIYRFTEGGTTPGVEAVTPGFGFGQPGQVVTHTFTVQNTGNGRDGFWLAAESEHSWLLEVQSGGFVAPIECGQTRSVQVAVTIPAETDLGVMDTLTLTVTSRLSSGISASAQATSVSSYRIYLPLVLKSAG